MNKGTKCTKCGKFASKQFYGKNYCKEHYLSEAYGCNNIRDFIDKYNISYITHTDGHMILRKRNKDLIKFLNELGKILDKDYWFGKGANEDDMHIVMEV